MTSARIGRLKTRAEESDRKHAFNLAALEQQKLILADELSAARAETRAACKKVDDKDREMVNVKRGNATYEVDVCHFAPCCTTPRSHPCS